MFTTGFKFFFGIGMTLATAAVLYGYTTGGNHMGPLSMGWKGGVGEHLGYSLLLGFGATAMTVALFLVFFRDADPSAQAHYAGVEQIPTNNLVTASFWPVVGAFGVGAMAVGLVLHTAVFVTGLVICGVVAVEWLMDGWADRATGDPEANRVLRNRVMAPVEIPALGAAMVALGVLATSRILLATSKLGSVVVAGIVSVLIVGIAVLFASRPRINKNVLAGSVLVLAVAVLAGGIVATVAGERDFVHHEDENRDNTDSVEGHEGE